MASLAKTSSQGLTYDQKKTASNAINKQLAKGGAIADFNYWRSKLPVNLDDSDAVERRLNEYVDYVSQTGMQPSYEGLAMALKISVNRLNQLETYMTAGVDTAEVVSRFKSLIGLMDYQMALDGVLAPSIYELRAGHFQNITKKTDLNITPVTPEKTYSPEDVEAMIKDNAKKKMLVVDAE